MNVKTISVKLTGYLQANSYGLRPATKDLSLKYCRTSKTVSTKALNTYLKTIQKLGTQQNKVSNQP